ncbi:MAG TPA: SRPBCC family protein [Actinomycetota bacterium]
MTSKTLVRRLGLLAGAAVAYTTLVRPWQLHWGATCAEDLEELPGDDLLPQARLQATRAVTIQARPSDVWPWLVQIGADKGGFYTYDALENAFGLGIHSVERLVSGWQHLRPGDFVAADRRKRGGWYVETLEPERTLVLWTGDPKTGWRFDGVETPAGYTWAYVLRELPDGSTRLLVRARFAYRNRLLGLPVELIELVDFLMVQRMLRGIRDRAEHCAPTPVMLEGTAA